MSKSRRDRFAYLLPSDTPPKTAKLLAKVYMDIQLIGLQPTISMAGTQHSMTLGYVTAMHDAGLIDAETWRGLLDDIVAASEARKRADCA
ncbi:hypothetical protein ACM7LV_27280 [Pseudomonas aeruginosa]|uniref:Uncharacterized protein n=1 Tax=Pseudomonas aeruginosa TaxID=287 RepID=A0A9P1W0J4_PSEAI|nr:MULTISPECIES: hypothetical protein [Pseudomonas]SCZ06630.1 Uncharacterised protein [Acinetobacter baumannii]EKX7258083.1 hypothetical protein [Pseudomonas aeruginosa]ELG7182571.1 hypothetical protein [Pseudomonas aeruginosa]ELI0480867.1 hypothetical protein [Pseudomonas aeruginosa]ELT7041577.1 hypothetical protein [Pseudomonas aeruginosa]